MTITPDANVDYEKNIVKDEKLASKKKFDTREGIMVFDKVDKEEKTINVMAVSLYENLLILDGVRYKILNMLTKCDTNF